MSILDWSDPEEMLGLLADYLRDELAEAGRDRERGRFLRLLVSGVAAVSSSGRSLRGTIQRLRHLYASHESEFPDDPALRHLLDCIVELERIAALSQRSSN